MVQYAVRKLGARSPPSSLLAVPNVTAHPSTVVLPITILLYNGPLLCGFSVSFKGLTKSSHDTVALLSKRDLYAPL